MKLTYNSINSNNKTINIISNSTRVTVGLKTSTYP